MESPQGSAGGRDSTTSVDKHNRSGDSSARTAFEEGSTDSEITLVERLNLLREKNPYYPLDERRHTIRKKIKEKFKDAPKTVLDLAEEEKPAIEKRLEDTDKALADLLAFGNEIITNIKVANEKRELLRVEFENIKKKNLKENINRESTEAIAQYDDIVARWSELGEIREPVIIFNKLDEQKKRIEELMNRKDEMIAECQREIDRMNERFQEDQRKQQTDICSLVERIDGQYELLKSAYKHHLDLLQDTIESERQTIALKERDKWEEFYKTMQDNEQYKLDVAKEKKLFYASEIQRITAQQEEITRATRIRLEKDAESLEVELRNTRNQVLMNSEKLDYNYQVLQKRNEENVVINNQQKRRVAKLAAAVAELKRRISVIQTNAQQKLANLTTDIQKLHDSISELEKKSENFRQSNRKKFFNIWSINYREIKDLIEKVFDIDRILCEHQLGLSWQRPDVDLSEFPMIAEEKGLIKLNEKNSNANYNILVTVGPNKMGGFKFDRIQCSSSKERFEQSKKKAKNLMQLAEEERQRNEKRIEVRLLRNILRKVSDRGRFMVEDRLLEFLEPYEEEQKQLVRIDNIFGALRIENMDGINKLIEYFRPYSWCPNCMKGIPRENLKKLYEDCHRIRHSDDSSDDLVEEPSSLESISDPSSSESNSQLALPHKVDSNEVAICQNHYLIVDSAMVLTALKEFTAYKSKQDRENEKSKKNATRSNKAFKEIGDFTQEPVCSVEIDNEAIVNYWRKFLEYMPKEKEKLWHSLEHGLQHYLQVLKQREQLDKDCAFLRRQNSELKYLLQKFDI